MTATAVIFGAGAVGRGLLGELLDAADVTPIFVETNPTLVDQLCRVKTYAVQFTGKTPCLRRVTKFRVLPAGDSAQVAEVLSRCRFAATAVGGQNLPGLAPLIANALPHRRTILNLLICENWPEADRILARAVQDRGGDPSRFRVAKASVERMIRPRPDSLDLLAESDQSVYADGPAWSGDRPKIPGLNFCDNFDAMYARKLFMNNAGHALLAYRGFLAGFRWIYQPLAVPEIRSHLTHLLSLACRALAERYNLAPGGLSNHLDDLITWRFANQELADPIRRVAKNPLRKLSPDERLVGLIRLLQAARIETDPICRVIAAAMRYRDPDDSECRELERIINHAGPEGILTKICGFDPHEPCFNECLNHYRKEPNS